MAEKKNNIIKIITYKENCLENIVTKDAVSVVSIQEKKQIMKNIHQHGT